MDPEMIRKIDSVLERVKEPESNLSVGELGIIQKFRYNENKRALYVFANTYGTPKACCFVITKLIEAEVMKRVKNELKKEFPELAINFV
jgi:metal-sulfur cluster biosynthetic enzyme